MANKNEYSTEFKELFITEVSLHAELWDKTHPKRKDQSAVDKLWTEVATGCGISKVEAKKLWKALVDQFRKLFRKVAQPAPNGSEYLEDADIKRVKWHYFQKMLFITKSIENRRTLTNMSAESQLDGTEFVEEETYIDDDTIDIMENALDEHKYMGSEEMFTCDEIPRMSPPIVPISGGCNGRKKVKRARLSPSPTLESNELLQQLNSIQQTLGEVAKDVQSSSSPSSSSSFGNVVNDVLQTVTPPKRPHCMRVIMEVLEAFAEGNVAICVTKNKKT